MGWLTFMIILVYAKSGLTTHLPDAVHVLPRHCGFSTVHSQALGSYNSSMGSWPWIALLYYRTGKQEKYACAGSLISERYVVTGAHCLDRKLNGDATLFRVRLGEHNVDTDIDKEVISRNPLQTDLSQSLKNAEILTITADPPQDFFPEKIMIHPKFQSSSLGLLLNDLAIIRLDRPAVFTEWVRPICLPEKPVTFTPSKKVYLAGWGKQDYYSELSTVLRHLSLPLLSSTECSRVYSQITNRNVVLDEKAHICAGGETGKDACEGDGGAPLMERLDDGRWILTGSVSFGQRECGKEKLPSIYTNMYTYVTWIQKAIEADREEYVTKREKGRRLEKLTDPSTTTVAATTEGSSNSTTEKGGFSNGTTEKEGSTNSTAVPTALPSES